MSDELLLVLILGALFVLFPFVIAVLAARSATPGKVRTFFTLYLAVLVSGAVVSYLGGADDCCYGPLYTFHLYLIFIAAPLSGAAVIGLIVVAVRRRLAQNPKNTDHGAGSPRSGKGRSLSLF